MRRLLCNAAGAGVAIESKDCGTVPRRTLAHSAFMAASHRVLVSLCRRENEFFGRAVQHSRPEALMPYKAETVVRLP